MDITIITQPKEVYNKVIYTFEAKIKDEVYSVARHEDDNGADLYINDSKGQDVDRAIYDIMEQLFYHDDFNYYERSQWQEDRVFTIETE
jgi:hypothetical protein